MDEGADSNLWKRLSKIFHGKDANSVESIIRNASKDGELDKEEGSMLLSVLTLDDLQVQEIMTPRTDMACAKHTATAKEIAAIIMKSGHSRIPIYQDNRDNIIGIVHAKDLFRYIFGNHDHEQTITDIIRPPFFIPETKKVSELLQEFKARKIHLAIILDEFGGTAGLVSIEDVLEEIVGEIEDEYDAPRADDISRQDDGSYLVAGRVYLEDLLENLGIDLQSEEVDTLGGYLSLIAGHVPKAGETFHLAGKIFTIQDADVKQVHTVHLSDEPRSLIE